MTKTLRLAAICLVMTVTGCWGHVFPLTNTFVHAVPARVDMFVDADGTFYPSDWRGNICHSERSLSWRADSLLAQARSCPGLRERVLADENSQLEALARFAAPKARIFILVHGYNNTATEAVAAYTAIESQLALRPDDAVIHFHWDGLTGTGIGGAKIWFNAAGYSKLVGSRGLRRILNRLHDKPVYLIAHSRGASVVLSALRDPVYQQRFLDAIHARGGELPAAEPFADNHNQLHVLMLAPAIDMVDFCVAADQAALAAAAPPCPSFPPFDRQLVGIRYTVNPHDPVLNKFIGLSRSFNPTGLGLTVVTGDRLQPYYGALMHRYVFRVPQRFHAFLRYAASPEFAAMLHDEGLD